MKSLLPTRITICLRTVLLFGLLNGLLFSCGEGIRLLPFPTVETSSELKTGKGGSYQKNIHHLEGQPTNAQSKYRRDGEKHSLGVVNPWPEFRLSDLTADPQKTRAADLIPLHSRLFTRNISGRAPPVA